jgi:hypothetical protein
MLAAEEVEVLVQEQQMHLVVQVLLVFQVVMLVRLVLLV